MQADRSIHDALCVLRCLVKKRFLTPGGGAPEAEASYRLAHWSNELSGVQAYCIKIFSQALEVRMLPNPVERWWGAEFYRQPRPPLFFLQTIPYTLAENAGLNAINIVTELRNKHAAGEKSAGINVRKGAITNIMEENVVVPLLVYTSAISLATECVRMILKIDDIIATR